MAITNKQRLNLIETYIREHQYADLHTLALQFSISLSTVRRALNDLETLGVIRRHHGGASLVNAEENSGYDFITQDDTNVGDKHRIAELVASRIHDGMTLMLDGGTTTYAVAKNLVRKRIIVITNSLPIAALLNEISSCETVVTGGTLYNRLGVLFGPTCENSLEHMHAIFAILGCAGFTAEGVWNSNTMLSSYQQKMIATSDQTWFVADSTKAGKRALSLSARYAPGIRIISSAPPAPDIATSIQGASALLEIC